MNPVKLKMFASTFLLIFFYFPQGLNGFIAACDGRNCAEKSRANLREFEQSPLKRENRVVNVRDRVGAERLVNNRRIVDSDSRISEYLESRNFDFPRLVERTHQSRVCDARRDVTNNRFTESRNTRVSSRNIQREETRNGETRLQPRDGLVESDKSRLIRNARVARATREDERNSRVEAGDRRETRIEVSNSRLARVENRNSRRVSRDLNSRVTRNDRQQDRDARVEVSNLRSARALNRDVRVRVTREDRNTQMEDGRQRATRDRDTRIADRNTRVEDRTIRLTRSDRSPDAQVEVSNLRSARNIRALNRDVRVRVTREDRNTRVEDGSQRATRDRDTRIADRNTRVEDRAIRLTRSDRSRDARVEDRNDRVREVREQIRVTRAPSRLIESRENREQNRISRDADVTRRERVSRNLNLRDTSRASENLQSARASESDSFRRDVRQGQRTNERSVRIMSRRVPETDRDVDVNNNRQSAERKDKVGDRDRRFGNRDSRAREVDVRVGEHYQKNNDFSQWSQLLTTTMGVLLLAQIVTSSDTKKFGLPQISHFLHGIKEKIY